MFPSKILATISSHYYINICSIHPATLEQLPWWLLISFGSYSLWSIGMGLLTLRECPEAYNELLKVGAWSLALSSFGGSLYLLLRHRSRDINLELNTFMSGGLLHLFSSEVKASIKRFLLLHEGVFLRRRARLMACCDRAKASRSLPWIPVSFALDGRLRVFLHPRTTFSFPPFFSCRTCSTFLPSCRVLSSHQQTPLLSGDFFDLEMPMLIFVFLNRKLRKQKMT